MVDKREIFVVHIEKKRSKALCVMTKQNALLFFWEWIGLTAIDLCYLMKPWSFSSDFVQRSCAGADVIRAAPGLRHANAIQFPFSRSKAPQEPW